MREIDLPVSFAIRHLADAKQALEIVEKFAKGDDGNQEYLRALLRMFQRRVKPDLGGVSVRGIQLELVERLTG